MMKKIVSSIIVIIMICSFSLVYATEPVENTNIASGEVQLPENDDTTNKEETNTPEDENQNTDNNSGDSSNSDTNTDGDNNTNGNPPNENNNTNQNPDNNYTDSDINSDNKDNNTDNNEGNENNNTDDDNQENNNQDNNGTNEQQPQQKPQTSTPNNSNTSNNNSYVQPKSSEARLKNMKVDVEGLTPEFDKNTTEYYLVVDLSVNKINVKASTVDSKAKWAIYGNKNLKQGENTVTIIVTAEDGTKKEYYIHVTKVDDVELANAELESLQIEGYNIYPTFKSNIYSYNLNINEKVNLLDIKAVSQNENATIEIDGNENLQEGENIIKINVTAENNETIRTYKINTYISLDKVEIQEESKLPAIILIIILGIIIIVLGIFIVLKKRR